MRNGEGEVTAGMKRENWSELIHPPLKPSISLPLLRIRRQFTLILLTTFRTPLRPFRKKKKYIFLRPCVYWMFMVICWHLCFLFFFSSLSSASSKMTFGLALTYALIHTVDCVFIALSFTLKYFLFAHVCPTSFHKPPGCKKTGYVYSEVITSMISTSFLSTCFF